MNQGPVERIEVRFNGIVSGLANLLLAPILYIALLLPPEAGLLLAIPVGAGIAYGLFLIAVSFDTRPLLIVAPEGVHLPVAGGILLVYDEFEVWTERRPGNIRGSSYRTFSLQGRPRVRLDIGCYAWLRQVRANGLLDGDLMLDERYVSTDVEKLAAAIEARTRGTELGGEHSNP